MKISGDNNQGYCGYGQHQFLGGGKHSVTTNDSLAYLNAVKNVFKDEKYKYEEFVEVLKDYKKERLQIQILIARVVDLFQGHGDLILGFNVFLPKDFKIKGLETDEPRGRKRVQFDDAIQFMDKIKTRFPDDGSMSKSFFSVLDMYHKGSKSIIEIYEEVAVLFRDNQDLLQEFLQFLPVSSLPDPAHHAQSERTVSFLHQNEKISANFASRRMKREKRKRNTVYHAELDLSVDHPDLDYEKLATKKHNKREKDRKEDSRTYHSRYNREMDQTSMIDFNNVERHPKKQKLSPGIVERVTQKTSRGAYKQDFHFGGKVEKVLHNSKGHLTIPVQLEDRDTEHGSELEKDGDCTRDEKGTSEPISDFDLYDYKSCNPSYQPLSKINRTLYGTKRTMLDDPVLNDCCVLVTRRSKDHSFKHPSKSQYEKCQFRCEDDRFELDMVMQYVKSTITCVEDLLDKIKANAVGTDGPICIGDYFKAMNLRSIQYLYGDRGLDVIEGLRQNANISLPIVLARLKQKQQEWSRSRLECNQIWASVNPKKSTESSSSVTGDAVNTVC
ncbi:hypothetical protein GIB67_006101 [Kingdonia uniflora]|uniref:Histone deacetylase interacting domain-containing protein n=1 Tax=Kingdonia uniflora TaxID=39325 RepID=A0A7J7LPW7_9MAGN|nr:hypothetical protein GIB67_006101 [Kingdonia uniflora]